MIEHRNVANFFAGMDARIPHAGGGTWLAVTSLSFDISVLELFWTLGRGFKVVITGDALKGTVSGGAAVPATGHGAGGMEFSLYYWGNDDGAGPRKYDLLLEGARFADAQLAERRQAQLPPLMHQALLSAESSSIQAAMDLLQTVKDSLLAQADSPAAQIALYDPVPMALQKRANVYRAQLVMESAQRSALHAALGRIDFNLSKGLRPAVRLRIEVDPQEI